MDQDIKQKIIKFQAIHGTVCRTLEGKTRQDTELRFCSVMAVRVLYGSEAWTVTSKDGSRLQAAEVHFLRAAEGCTSQDVLKNEDTRKEFGVELMQKCNMLQRQLEIIHRKNTRARGHVVA
jgi:hypothetical protein